MRWEILVTYDVNTETKAGRRRLRKVAAICSGFGQRVQLSVFECRVTQAQYEALEARLLQVIDPAEDRLRLYRLPADREKFVRIHGIPLDHDIREPLIV
ncbi:MAG: CRISPR-associated endonuclease Cas2 [Thermomicrobiales bacterium]|nr:CRISPR-associated endonuclease Cas2 [Thermomicrobiales bacterium]